LKNEADERLINSAGLPYLRIYMLLLRSGSFGLLLSPYANCMSRVLDKLVVAQPFMEPEGSVPSSEDLDIFEYKGNKCLSLLCRQGSDRR
jgi:hypothetical protein